MFSLSDDFWEWIMLVGVVLVVFFLGCVFGVAGSMNVMERQAIAHGAARYHPETAKFEWLSKPIEVKE